MVLLGAEVGTWVLAGATASLAVFTAMMAWFTRKSIEAGERTATAAEQDMRQSAELVTIGQDQVRETQRQADLALSALEAERQPLLVPTTTLEPWDPTKNWTYRGLGGAASNAVKEFPVAKCWIDPNTNIAWIVVKFKNVGRGTALLNDGSLSAVIMVEGEHEHGGFLYSVTVALNDHNDRMVVTFSAHPELSAVQKTIHGWVQGGHAFTVEVRYSDVARRRHFATLAMYGGSRPNPEVIKVEVTEE